MIQATRITRGPQFSPEAFLPYITSPQGEKQIALTQLKVEVCVTGLYAETTQTMTFYNPNKRDLEGELNFPMPDNATVCGYALDVEGVLVDGVIVEKERARQIIETEIRIGADPGLLEQVAGNIYKTRIYPILAKGTRTVRVRYISDLKIIDQNAAYHLPLSHAKHIDKVSVKLEVAQVPVQPELSGIGNTVLTAWNNKWIAEANLTPQIKADEIVIELPKIPKKLISIEKFNEECFFAVSLKQPDKTAAAWNPKHLGIVWDASGSRLQPGQKAIQSLKKEFELLRKIANKFEPVSYDLMVFRNIVEPEIISFTTVAELINHLENIPYDGSSCLSTLDLNKFSPSIDGVCLFSDGLNSGDHGVPPVCTKPVITINSQATCNSAFLEYLAEQSMGVYINLLTATPQQAITEISNVGQVISIDNPRGMNDVFVQRQSGRISVLGKVVAATAEITINGEIISLAMGSEPSAISTPLALVWAGFKAREIAVTSNDTKELVALGRRYGIVTPGTSFLVLESIIQYLKHDVCPPDTLPEMQQKFTEVKSKLYSNEAKMQREHQLQVIEWWEARKQWWKEDHKSSYSQKINGKAEQLAIDELQNQINELNSHSDNDSIMSDMSMLDSDSIRFSAMHDPGTDDLCCCENSIEDAGLFGEEDLENLYDKQDLGEKVVTGKIHIQGWSPKNSYMKKLRQAPSALQYEHYIELRRDYTGSPSFFLDCGNHFLESGELELGVRILSNLEELQLGDIALLRIYAWRLQQAKLYEQAINIFERILAIREDEPQSHRDLALALIDRWENSKSAEDARRAMALLYAVVSREWERFPEIELIALMELNRLIFFAKQQAIEIPEYIDPQLIANLDLDVRISMSWDADLTDVDLHVHEPDEGHAYYGHNRTDIGGLVSRDFTDGYGPEEYILRRSMPGKYIIKAHYYGSHQQKSHGPCTITATIFTNYGRKNEKKQVMTLRLDDASDEALVGEIMLEGEEWKIVPPDPSQREILNNLLMKIDQLSIGMTQAEVINILGASAKVETAKVTTLVYSLRGKQQLQLKFEPKLSSGSIVTDRAEQCIL